MEGAWQKFGTLTDDYLASFMCDKNHMYYTWKLVVLNFVKIVIFNLFDF